MPSSRSTEADLESRLPCSMFDRYNIVNEDDLRMAAQKTILYVDTRPSKRVPK